MPLFEMMSRRLAWLGKRQEVLAQNIANADTPGFRARDLKQPTFRQLLGASATDSVPMERTNAAHIVPAGSSARNDFKSEEERNAELSISKNSVDLDEQMMKVTKTAMDHQLTVNLYRKHIAMIKAALGRPGS